MTEVEELRERLVHVHRAREKAVKERNDSRRWARRWKALAMQRDELVMEIAKDVARRHGYMRDARTSARAWKRLAKALWSAMRCA